MPTVYLTEDYTLVRREGEDSLLVQIPEKQGKNGTGSSPARKERIPLIKIDEVVVLGEVTIGAFPFGTQGVVAELLLVVPEPALVELVVLVVEVELLLEGAVELEGWLLPVLLLVLVDAEPG